MTSAPGREHDGPVLRLAISAIGVVYGDIGTSPLYTLKECFGPHVGFAPTRENVLGILSLIFWSVMLVVTGKYVTFVMRADNRGEGGDMALLALALRGVRKQKRLRWLLVMVGMCGTALFYGDSMITPAISVLSAIEGLELATPVFHPYIVPLALAVLVMLFVVQRHGTERVGGLFGPIMLLWFVVLALLGLVQIVTHPSVLLALNPLWGLEFFLQHRLVGFFALGAVVLALTGAEALYADMGHFGRKPIRLAWFALVMPALMLNYFGQGALIIENPEAVANPFYLLVPHWMRLPMVVLATLATVIASQAVISGAFSITRQAIQLGYVPRLRVRHTSEATIGQVFISQINWGLCFAVMWLVVTFRSSSNLASAYGIAVTGTMITTSILFFVVMVTVWGWRWQLAAAVVGFFGIIDICFFAANIIKVVEGGWFPLLIGAVIFSLMTTWKRGVEILAEMRRRDALALDDFLARITDRSPHRVKGTAVYMTANPFGVPQALLHNLKHNKVLHERVVLLTIQTEDIPYVAPSDRIAVTELEKGFRRIVIHYGFMDQPDVPRAMEECAKFGLTIDMMETSFFLGRETLIPARLPLLARWRERLFIWLARNGISATEFFRIPTNRVVELGEQLEF
ncbi:MAG: potassium transporter Kup [Alphaproteobacteria bacterium]|nr:potassium transporter Kup [Alphaproteobacteria bacterium]